MNDDVTVPVLVTGATGYVAGWIVKKLLDEGFTVHAAVRDPNNQEKLDHLNQLAANSKGQIRYFKADLLNNGSYAEAMRGCRVVFHTASPFTSNYKDPQKELIDPAVMGTTNVLEEANKQESVQRVVLTSSCAAIYTDAIDMRHTPKGIFTEEVWNSTASLSHQPYSYSKTLAEKQAWELAKKQSRWRLVVVNPSMVMGPALNPKVATSESVHILKQVGDGTLKLGAPAVGLGMVDVRDLAEAHFQAAFREDATGRHIINGHNTSMLEIAKVLHAHYGQRYPIPNKAIPKWLLMMVGPMVNKALTRRFIKGNVGVAWKADNSKSQEKLGIQYRSMETTLRDSFEVLIESGLV